MSVHAGSKAASYTKPTTTVIDKRGREIVVSKPTALGMFRLAKLLGDAEKSSTMFNMAFVAGCVESIDGQPEPAWTTIDGLERAVGRLDLDGIEAAGNAIKLLQDSEEEVIEQAKN